MAGLFRPARLSLSLEFLLAIASTRNRRTLNGEPRQDEQQPQNRHPWVTEDYISAFREARKPLNRASQLQLKQFEMLFT
jgi:hypothetical protein